MGLGNEAVKDGVCDGGFGDVLVPFTDRKLGDDDGASPFVAVFEELEQEQFYRVGDGLETEVIEDQEAGFFEPVEPLDGGAFGLGDGDLFAKTVHVEVEGAQAHRAGVVAQRAGQMRLATAGCAGDEDVLSATNPGHIGEHSELVFGEVAGGRAVDILEGDGVAKFAQPEVEFHAPALPVLTFGIDEAGDEFVSLGLLVERGGQDGLVGVGHASELEVAEGGKGSCSHKIKY